MFEQRLKRMMIGFAIVAVIIIARLIDLQVVTADYYRRRAESALLYPARTLPFVRGRILDRQGHVLAADEPCWQVNVTYAALQDATGMAGAVSSSESDALWRDLAAFSDRTIAELKEQATRIVDRIAVVHHQVSERLGYDVTVREETVSHPMVTGLNDQQQIDARKLLTRHGALSVEYGVKRTYTENPSFGHVLGQLGAVGPDDLRNDPNFDDPLARYEATEFKGVSGIEYADEQTLRGRRGRSQTNRRGQTIQDIEPVPGREVILTIRSDLQEAVYSLLDRRVGELCPYPAGAAVAILHVPTREVLALVSYPGYDANQYRLRYDDLRADTRTTPLRFRAVANAYEPGSIVKPITCLAGLSTGVIDRHTRFNCTGYYFDNVRDRLRCWPIAGTNRRKAHGSVNVVEAIAGSCNIFMYHVADLVGVDRLTGFFDMAGFGRSTGVGLREERWGINPTPSWLMQHRNVPATLGRARNFAIGQGELAITPLQAANLVATYASGRWQPVSLTKNAKPAPAWNLPCDPSDWLAIREGLYRVTNDRLNGTAYRKAHWINDRYAMCGKTGSATTPAAPTHYRIDYVDPAGQQHYTVVPAKTRRNAAADFIRQHPDAQFDPRDDVQVADYWPPKSDGGNERFSHAWFVAFLQPIASDGSPLLDQTAPIAFAVIVEFGGSGGYTTGPIAKDIADIITKTLGQDLDPDAPGGTVDG